MPRELYRGTFCEGLFGAESREFGRWAEEQRERFHDHVVRPAWQLVDRYEGNEALTEACTWGKEAVRLDPDEHRLRWLLGLYERRGDRSGALRMYQSFQQRLEQEFGLQPALATERLVARIRADAAS